MPTAEYVGKYFEVKEYIRGEHNGVQTLITQAGRDHFHKILKKITKELIKK